MRTLTLGDRGPDVEAWKRAVHRYLNQGGLAALNRQPKAVRRLFGPFFQRHVKEAQQRLGLAADGILGPTTQAKLAPHLDLLARQLLDQAHGHVPQLGPVFAGGKSVLDHDLTHATGGIPLYPAFDDAFREGLELIAPERITVTRDSSSRPGDAFYADGESGLRYWFGHLAVAPAVGRVFAPGQAFGKVGANTIGGGPHVHVGVNVERLFGTGKELKHHTNYTHGGKTVGEQLRRRPA